MDPIAVDEYVEVLAYYSLPGKSLTRLRYPRKMKYRGEEIAFKELNLRHPTKKGQRMIHVYDVSDGANDYRLEFDAEAEVWKLREITFCLNIQVVNNSANDCES